MYTPRCWRFRISHARSIRAAWICALVALGLFAASAAPAASSSPRGFLVSRSDRLYSHERRLMAAIDPVAAEQLFDRIVARPRVAGTPGAASTARFLSERLTGWGWDVELREYRVYLPHATRVEALRVAPSMRELLSPNLRSGSEGSYPAAAGYSAAGEVEAPVVFAHRGDPADFARLRAAGVRVAGSVVLIRYGESFRGAKVAAAERAGAAAVLLYSDPADDGAARGPVFPAGPFRPADAIERGSVKVADPGDPTTPGMPSHANASRGSLADPRAGIPNIPVVAIGSSAARELLAPLTGPAAPAEWQGGLALRYHLGGTEAVRVRVRVDLDEEPYKTITNVLAWQRGTERPDQVVVAGAHYDSWTDGAVDNASGTVSLLLTARAFARLRQLGERPARTVLLAFWDAEEWGLIGSTEYVEDREALLDTEVVAYLNQDGVAGGPFFSASASPSLARLLRDVTLVVPDPATPSASVHDEWVRRSERAGFSPRLTPPAAGSDDAPFFAHLGVPSAGFGFHGGAGIYHSDHDGAEFMRRFGDPGFAQHVAAARITSIAAWRLADADVLPLEYSDYGRVLLGHARALPAFEGSDAERRQLETAAAGFLEAALWFEDASTIALAARRSGVPLRERANRHLMNVERRLTRPGGLTGRAWHRNVVFAPERDDAYRVVVFPGVVEALAGSDRERLRNELTDLTTRIEAATRELERAAGTMTLVGPTATGGA